MAKGEYLWQPGVSFALQNFFADLVPKATAPPQCFIKTTQIEHGRVFVSTTSLTRLFQEKIEQGTATHSGGEKKSADAKNGKDGSKGKDGKQQISDIEIRAKGDQLAISGKVKKLISIPFELTGPVDVVNDHALRFHVDKIKAAGIESKGLLDALGVHLTKMLHPDAAKGVTILDDAILFDTEAIANIKGKISHTQISGNNLVIDFVPQNRQPYKVAAISPKKRPPSHAVAAATPAVQK